MNMNTYSQYFMVTSCSRHISIINIISDMKSQPSYVNIPAEQWEIVILTNVCLLSGAKNRWVAFVHSSVATKIEKGPKTNMKILWFLKIDRRRRIFVNSKILRRSSKIANSSKIWRFSKENEKFSLLKIFFQAAT